MAMKELSLLAKGVKDVHDSGVIYANWKDIYGLDLFLKISHDSGKIIIEI